MSRRKRLADAAHQAAMALMDFSLWLRRTRGPSDFAAMPGRVFAGAVAERKAWLDEFAALVPGAEIQPIGPRIEQVVAMVGGRPCSWRVGETAPEQAAASLRNEPLRSPKQFDSRPAVLDGPGMDGTTWLAAATVTDAMLAAWPAWETRRRSRSLDDGVRWARYLRTWFSRDDLEDWEYRPLRLFGMNERAEIDAADMTEQHFERIENWQWKVQHHKGWMQDDMLQGWAGYNPMAPCCIEYPGELGVWRPAIWAELDET